MKIAIDIDETLVIHEKRDVEYTLKFAKENNLDFTYNNGVDFKEGITIEWTADALEKFWSTSFGKNFYKYSSLSSKNRQIIKTLQKRGHQIILITSRNPKWTEITQNWAKRNLQNVEVVFSKDKVTASKENNVDVLIDNDLATCLKTQKAGVKTFWFNGQKNKGVPVMQDLNDLLKLAKDMGENYER